MAEHAAFPTTRWSLVRRGRAALDEIYKRYYAALRSYVVQYAQVDRTQADDLVQGFVTDRLVATELLDQISEEGGRFRTLLKAAIRWHVIDVIRRDGRQKRGGADVHQPISNQLEAKTPDAGRLFDVEWATALIHRAVERTKDECLRLGRHDVWRILEARVVHPSLEGGDPQPYAELHMELGLESPTQAGNLLVTGKRMFHRSLRFVVSEYAQDDADIDQEINELRTALSFASPREFFSTE